MRNFPVISCKVYEGTLTRYTDAVTPTGGKAEGAAVYQYPLNKGNLVTMYTHTETEGNIIVKRKYAGNDLDIAFGIAVSDPSGIDNTTVSGQTPVKGLRRTVDVAFFGLGIIELVASATGAVAPGDMIGLDEDEQNEVETETAYASVTLNGSAIALTYAAAGSKVAILMGSCCYFNVD